MAVLVSLEQDFISKNEANICFWLVSQYPTLIVLDWTTDYIGTDNIEEVD